MPQNCRRKQRAESIAISTAQMVCAEKFSLVVHRTGFSEKSNKIIAILEQINFEKLYLLCKDLSANPCHEMLVGELSLPLNKHFNVKMLWKKKYPASRAHIFHLR